MKFLLTILSFIIITNIFSQAGGLDSSYSDDGKKVVDITGLAASGYDVVVQPDEKVVLVGGHMTVSNGQDIGVVRLDKFGVEDSTFSGDARIGIDYDHAHDYGKAVCLQPDGKILVAGEATYTNGSDTTFYNYIVLRFLSNGSPDISFGINGRTIVHFETLSSDRATDMVLQPDGKIIVGGSISRPSIGTDFGLVRLLSNGNIDTTFGANGKVITSISPSADYCTALALQPDGKIIACGYKYNTGCDQIVVRYKSNGILDSTFNADGMYVQMFSYETGATATTIRPDGKILVAGWRETSGTYKDIQVYRFNPNGYPDASFGTSGYILTSIGSSIYDETGYGIKLQDNGCILVCGSMTASPYTDFCLLRYDSTGTLDPSFNGTGIVQTSFGSGTDDARAIDISPSGRIVVAGNDGYKSARYWTSGPIPFASFVGNNLNVCRFQQVQFTSTSSGYPTNYNWYFPGGTPSSSNLANPVVFYNTAGNYSVTLVISNVSGSDSVTYASYIHVNAFTIPIINFPPLDTICTQYGSVLLTGATPTGGSYSGGYISGGYFDAMASGPGTFPVIYTKTQNGCTGSDTSSIVVISCLANEQLSISESEIYPNPTQGIIYLNVQPSSCIRITNYLGEELLLHSSKDSIEKVDLSEFPKGIYYFTISFEGDEVVKKIIKY